MARIDQVSPAQIERYTERFARRNSRVFASLIIRLYAGKAVGGEEIANILSRSGRSLQDLNSALKLRHEIRERQKIISSYGETRRELEKLAEGKHFEKNCPAGEPQLTVQTLIERMDLLRSNRDHMRAELDTLNPCELPRRQLLAVITECREKIGKIIGELMSPDPKPPYTTRAMAGNHTGDGPYICSSNQESATSVDQRDLEIQWEHAIRDSLHLRLGGCDLLRTLCCILDRYLFRLSYLNWPEPPPK